MAHNSCTSLDNTQFTPNCLVNQQYFFSQSKWVLCVSCFVWVVSLAVVVCPMWSCLMTTLVHCTGFRPVPLQMNRPILFYFFNKIRQNCPFCFKKKSSILKDQKQKHTYMSSKTHVFITSTTHTPQRTRSKATIIFMSFTISSISGIIFFSSPCQTLVSTYLFPLDLAILVDPPWTSIAPIWSPICRAGSLKNTNLTR
jgi:hypothetical protein